MERTIMEWVVRADMFAERSMMTALDMFMTIGRFAMGVIFVFGALMLMSVAGLAAWARIDEKRMRKRGRAWTRYGRR